MDSDLFGETAHQDIRLVKVKQEEKFPLLGQRTKKSLWCMQIILLTFCPKPVKSHFLIFHRVTDGGWRGAGGAGGDVY